MKKIHSVFCISILSLMLGACVIAVSPSVPITDSAQPTLTPTTTVLASIDNVKSLNLSGKLIYTSGKVNATPGKLSLDLSVHSLDLVTGATTTIYAAPPGDWVDSATVSPDGKLLLISAQPPRTTGQPGFYSMPLDASQPPQLLLATPTDKDLYYQPQWSPDGKYVYFTHKNYQGTTSYEIMRMSYPNGDVQRLAEQAYWPSISEDGSRITYASVDTATGTNGLFIANANGTQTQEVSVSGPWPRNIIDAPIFFPNNQAILFSAPISQQFSTPNWVDKILGITVVYAHGSIPSEWWSIPLGGGKPTQLTRVGLLGLFASFSPDGSHVASYSTDGIFIMKPDGTDLTKVVDDVGSIPGTVDWVR
jgi:Tol biopolymer transport system component